MAASARSFLLFSFSLLFLVSHSPFPATAAAGGAPPVSPMISAVCLGTSRPERCLALLQNVPAASAAKDYVELSKTFLTFAIVKATINKRVFAEVLRTNNAPAIQECAGNHDDTVKAFQLLLQYLNQDPTEDISYDAAVTIDNVSNCQRALIDAHVNVPAIGKANKKLGLLCAIVNQAIGKIPVDADADSDSEEI